MLPRLAAVLLLLPAPVLAQAVRGSVRDSATGEHLPAVTVRALDEGGQLLASSLSDAGGRFELRLPPGSGVRLRFERLGYRAGTFESIQVERGQTLELQVRLVATPVPLDSIAAVARPSVNQKVAEFYERAARNRRLGVGRIWTRADLVGQRRISHVLRTVNARKGCTRMETYVDGMPTSMMPADALATALLPIARAQVQEVAGVRAVPDPPEVDPTANVVDWLLPPEDLEGIEVYRDSEIPTQFNPEGLFCQVTLLWRRTPVQAPIDFRKARGSVAVIALGFALGALLTVLH